MIAPGDRIDRYEVEALLGQGGMGTVYRAYDRRLRRRVAIKLVRVERDVDGRAPARLLEEARAAAALDHPNVVSVFDVGESDGAPFIAMELVTGRSLRDYVGDARVALPTRLFWLGDIARALEAAHARGIIHRDVKPSNVVVRHDGVVKVLDFGLARRSYDDPADPPPSSRGPDDPGDLVGGTPGYVSPEQMSGGDADARSDQFAWGVVAFQLLTGEKPWRTGEVPFDDVLEPALPFADRVPGLPEGVEAVVLRALARSPDQRFASMGDVVRALAASVRAARRLSAAKAKGLAIGALALIGTSFLTRDAVADARATFEGIRSAESTLGPLPPESTELVLGSLDCDTGVFTMGTFPAEQSDVAGGGYNSAQHVTTHRIGAFAKRVRMRLSATNRRGRALSASLAFGSPAWTQSNDARGGIGSLINPRAASGDDDFVSFELGEAIGRFTFAVKCGDAVASGPPLFNGGHPYTGYRDPLHCPKENPFCNCPPSSAGCTRREYRQHFEHAHGWAGGGVFEVEMLPVAILYEPPVDHGKKSFVEAVVKGGVGSNAALHFADAAASGPAVSPPMLDASDAAAEATATATLLARTGAPYATASRAVLEAIARATGGGVANPAAAATSATRAGLRTRLASSAVVRTGTGSRLLGPGDGDYAWYYHHAYFAWVAENGQPMRVVFLGAQEFVSHQIAELADDLALLGAGRDQAATASKLSRKAILTLLALDPFVSNGPGAPLPAPRFVDVTRSVTHPPADVVCPRAPLPPIELAVDAAWTHPDVSASLPIEALGHGRTWLSFLGTGGSDATLTAALHLSRAHDWQGVERSVFAASLQGDATDTHCTKIYFDELFGTFAFRESPPSG